MAVDFWHRLVVRGPHGTVDLLRRQLRCRVRRSVAGHKLWRETVPFSFERLYQLVPGAVRIERQVPCDPYDMSAWPIRRLVPGLAEVRYQLHTRNMEMLPFVRLLSRKFRRLSFFLVTLCLDDSEVASYQIRDGRVRMWILPEARQERHWECARQKFALAGDSVYDDEEAARFVEEAMLEEAMSHCERASKETGTWRRVTRIWWNRPILRDLFTEKLIAATELNNDRHSRKGNKEGNP